MNYLILGQHNYTPNACVSNIDDRGEDEGGSGYCPNKIRIKPCPDNVCFDFIPYN